MGMFKAVVYTSVIVVVLAYILNDPVPEGLEPVLPVKVHLGAFKAVALMYKSLYYLGFEEGTVFRNLLNFIATSVPDPRPFPDVKVTHMKIADVPVVIYTPKGASSSERGIVYYHGGGWVIASPELYGIFTKELAQKLNAVVISVDYRLAPEHPYPAAIDDSGNVTLYVLEHAKEFGIDPKRVAIMGDSAGGHMTAIVSIRLRDMKSKIQPKLQVLIYPVTQALDLDTPSYRANKNGPFLTINMMAFFFTNYLFGTEAHKYIKQFEINNHTTSIIKKSNAKTFMNIKDLPKDDYLKGYKPDLEHGNLQLWNEIKDTVMDVSFSPLFAPDLKGLPPAYVVVCQYDVLRDDGIFYAKRLKDAGVRTTLNHIDLCYHAWVLNPFEVPMLREETFKIIKYLDDNL